MQVNHTADHITHAFIGGHKTIEFGISNSAEFFQILSSTLYSDQHLAVAREVLCNAWDAHIRAIGEKDGRSRNELMTTLFDVPEVRSLHGLTSTLDAHDLMVVSIWRNMMDNHYHFSKDAKVQAAAKAITDMPVSPIVADIVLKVGTTGFTHLIDVNVVQQIVRNTDSRLNGKLDVLAKLTHALLG